MSMSGPASAAYLERYRYRRLLEHIALLERALREANDRIQAQQVMLMLFGRRLTESLEREAALIEQYVDDGYSPKPPGQAGPAA